jgi:hypothetical protein
MSKRSPREYHRVLNQYSQFMEEIKKRQAVINSVLDAKVAVPKIVGAELCYLQLRLICELIALACLTVHEDIEATNSGRLRKAYAADWIIERLENLHPEFYPRPSRQILDAAGRPVRVEPITDGYLTRRSF